MNSKQEFKMQIIEPTEDYVNNSTYFHDARRKARHYFIIHPDFVSENNKATQRRQLDEKHFGQSVLGSHY